jgi:hypothetical protein
MNANASAALELIRGGTYEGRVGSISWSARGAHTLLIYIGDERREAFKDDLQDVAEVLGLPIPTPPDGYRFVRFADHVIVLAHPDPPRWYRPQGHTKEGNNADPDYWPPEHEAARRWAAHLLGDVAPPRKDAPAP